jgi:hypothetical protein
MTIIGATYLWEFKNGTGVGVYCISTNTATAAQIERSDKFVIIETGSTTAIPLSGQVQLNVGDYDLKIYEQLSTTNLDPTGLTCVQEDIVTVLDSTINTNKVYTGGSTTNKIYNGS